MTNRLLILREHRDLRAEVARQLRRCVVADGAVEMDGRERAADMHGACHAPAFLTWTALSLSIYLSISSAADGGACMGPGDDVRARSVDEGSA